MSGATTAGSSGEVDWDVRATQSAVAAMKVLISADIVCRGTLIERVSDTQWGWMVVAAIFAWIKTKSRQAVAEGGDLEAVIRTMQFDPSPWEIGATEAILPTLARLESFEWSKPLGEWSEEKVVQLSWHIHRLVDAGLSARDKDGPVLLRYSERARLEREISAANGGPLLDRSEVAEGM
jgi:hypothetical protein